MTVVASSIYLQVRRAQACQVLALLRHKSGAGSTDPRLAQDLGKRKITVNAISPGLTLTEMMEQGMPKKLKMNS